MSSTLPRSDHPAIEYLDPYILVPLEGGGFYPSEDHKVIEAYMTCCVVEPDLLICRQGGLELARDIKRAIVSFFLPESAEGDRLKT